MTFTDHSRRDVDAGRTSWQQWREERDTGLADELLITTATHDPADKFRSFELIARAWYA